MVDIANFLKMLNILNWQFLKFKNTYNCKSDKKLGVVSEVFQKQYLSTLLYKINKLEYYPMKLKMYMAKFLWKLCTFVTNYAL
jgi:hypothetical protein